MPLLSQLFRQLQQGVRSLMMSSGEEENAPIPWEGPSVSNVLAVKDILLQVTQLPIELVEEIIDFAEYWPYTTATCGIAPLLIGTRRSDVLILASLPLGYDPEETQGKEYGISIEAYNSYHANPYMDRNIPEAVPVVATTTTDQVIEGWKRQSVPRGKFACRKVVFTITSRDQGWGGDRNENDGLYQGSYTWFDVGKARTRTVQIQDVPIKEPHDYVKWLDRTTHEYLQLPLSSSSRNVDGEQSSGYCDLVCSLKSTAPPTLLCRDPVEPVRLPVNGDNNARMWDHPSIPGPSRLQSNRTAEKTEQTHVITWRADDCIKPDTDEAAHLESQGRGGVSGDGDFVRSLAFGDVITVWARARFPGWTNHISSAKMEVYWAV